MLAGVLVVAVVLLASSAGHSAQVFWTIDGVHLAIVGDIKRGDYQKVRELLRSGTKEWEEGGGPRSVGLKSDGGDADKAMKIGRLVRTLYLVTNVSPLTGLRHL